MGDPTDSDNDGVPDAVTLNIPAGFSVSVTFDFDDAAGELDFFLGDIFPPLTTFPMGPVVDILFTRAFPPVMLKHWLSFPVI